MEKKYTDQIFQENLQLKKVLNVTIIPESEDLLGKLYSGDPVYMSDLNSLLNNSQNTLMENQSVFDTLISNMLGEENIHGLQFLQRALVSIDEERNKTINNKDSMQKFFVFFKEIVVNYFVLVLMNPDLFPSMQPQSPDDDDGLDLSAWRFAQMLENGFSSEYLGQINNKIMEDNPDEFEEFWQKTLVLLLKKANKASLLSTAKSLADTFTNLSTDQRILKLILDLGNYPWIPGPSGINLKGGFGSCTGDNLETISPLGILFKPSYFPISTNLRGDKTWDEMITKIMDDLHSSKSQAVFDKTAKKYQEINHRFGSSC